MTGTWYGDPVSSSAAAKVCDRCGRVTDTLWIVHSEADGNKGYCATCLDETFACKRCGYLPSHPFHTEEA